MKNRKRPKETEETVVEETKEETAEDSKKDEEEKEPEKTNIYYVTDEVQQSQYINMFREKARMLSS